MGPTSPSITSTWAARLRHSNSRLGTTRSSWKSLVSKFGRGRWRWAQVGPRTLMPRWIRNKRTNGLPYHPKEVAMRRFLVAVYLTAALLSSPTLSFTQPTSATHTERQRNPEVKVWVNTHSGVYHCPG